jgi:large subunit ribosomal protein L32
MPVPKKRHNQSRTRRRRGGHPALKPKSLISCDNCGKKIMPHQVCSYCGTFKGREIINISKAAKMKKSKAK